MDKQEIRAHLTGPIDSVRTPFQRDGSVDFDGLRNVIEFDLAAGSKTILLTVGDSHYICLSDEEIAQITRVTVEQTRGRGMVVAADRFHATDRAVAFARFAREAGADVVMCLPPDWGGSCTPQTLAEHYLEVARVMPVMIVTGVFIPRGSAFALETIKRALDGSENVVAIKDDMCGDFARRLCLLAHERCAVFAGGTKENHMNMLPYGVDGYLSTFITFKPDVAHRYWRACEANDLPAARGVIRDLDMPLFDYVLKVQGGFDAAMHALQEIYGIAGRWRRKPYYSFNDAEMEQFRSFLRGLGLL